MADDAKTKANAYKSGLKPIWCPGCGIGLIMTQLSLVMDDLGLDEGNTVLVTGIGCTGRMGGYMHFDAVYTLHGRTLPVAEAIKTQYPDKPASDLGPEQLETLHRELVRQVNRRDIAE